MKLCQGSYLQYFVFDPESTSFFLARLHLLRRYRVLYLNLFLQVDAVLSSEGISWQVTLPFQGENSRLELHLMLKYWILAKDWVFSLSDVGPMRRVYFKYLTSTITSWAFSRVTCFEKSGNIILSPEIVFVYRTIEAPLKLLKWVKINYVQI